MSQAWKELHSAMQVLAGDGSLRKRLAKAYKSNLMHLRAKDVPAEIRDNFVRLARNLGRVSAGKGECRIERAVALYDEQEVSLMVNSILEMYDAVTRYEPVMTLRDMNQQLSNIDIFASR